jgi:hypothetical protein
VSFLAPIWLAAAAIVGMGVVIAHLFTATVPPQDVLPTVRFVPEGTPMTVLRSRRVSDLLLLFLRLLAVTLLGLALAGAHVRRDAPPRVVVVDLSRAVASVAELRDSVQALTADGVFFVAFDAAARAVSRDALATLSVSTSRGSLSAGLVAAHRAVAHVSDGRDRTELVIVSPLVREAVDSATAPLLALWEGPVRLVRVAPGFADTVSRVEIRTTGDDPVDAALGSRLSAVGPQNRSPRAPTRLRRVPDREPRNVRVVRTLPTRADSAWARDSAGVLVLWPTEARGVLTPRAVADSQGGVAGRRDVVVAGMGRQYQPRAGRVLVRWVDGTPAATEMPLGRGCVREVAIPVDAAGDLALRASFRGIAQSLAEPCGGARDFRPVVIPSTAGVIPSTAHAPSERSDEGRNLQLSNSMQIPRFARDDNALPLWLAVFALAVLIAEQLLRSRGRAAA